MSEEEVASIYKPFVQADLSITRKHGGTGLGLSICKQLAEGMGGSIEVSSEPGRGTLFRVRLWLGLAAAGDIVADEPGVQELPQRYLGARVLVVDDQQLNREVVFELLATVGIVPQLAEDGRQAVDILAAAGAGAFDLVLMDIQMPVMDGLSATQRIRALPGFAGLPIVAMTAHTMVHEKRAYLAKGMSDHLGKPFALPDFFAMLAKWLAARIDAGSAAGANSAEIPGESVATVASTRSTDDELGTIAGLDAVAGSDRFSGNVQRYRHWLGVFVDDAPGVVASLRDRLAAGRREEARQAVHAFKGRVGMLGMTAIHAQVVALESAIARGEAGAESTPPLTQQLEQSVEAMCVSVRGALRSLLPATSPAASLATARQPRPAGPTPPSIEALQRQLENSDGGSAAAIEACLGELGDTSWPPLLRAVLAAVQRFDFDAAATILAGRPDAEP